MSTYIFEQPFLNGSLICASVALSEATGFISLLIVFSFILTAVKLTFSDIAHIATGDIGVDKEGINETNVHIKNSHKIHTPWVRLAYAYCLNHINSETRNIIKGSSLGASFEWFCHNVGHAWFSLIGDKNHAEQAAHADIGATIFSDSREGDGLIWSLIMKCAFCILFPKTAKHDYEVWKENGEL